MGIIVSVTPRITASKPIHITKCTVSSEEIVKAAQIDVKFFSRKRDIATLSKFEILPELPAIDKTKVLSNLWQFAWLVQPMKPLWNGYMKSTHNDLHPGKSAVHFMPMIDMKASDYSCIYSTMHFVSEQAHKYLHDAVLTFDQPLYLKAMEIKMQERNSSSRLKDIVLILGTFHTCMSFYGSIGYLMTGSGLPSLLELIYAEHTVPHVLSGKAFSRATSGHLIIAGVLSALITSKSITVTWILTLKGIKNTATIMGS